MACEPPPPTALHAAAAAGDALRLQQLLASAGEALPMLLDARAGPDEATPLLRAVQSCSEAAVALLLAAGAQPDCAGAAGLTPLHASVSCSPSLMRLLLQAGAPPQPVNERGLSPLHQCAGQARPEHAALLLAAGADPRLADGQGNTALSLARSRAVAQLLLGALAAAPQPGDAALLAQAAGRAAAYLPLDVFVLLAQGAAARAGAGAVAGALGSRQVWPGRRSEAGAALVRACLADCARCEAGWADVRAQRAALPGERRALRQLLLGAAPVASRALRLQAKAGAAGLNPEPPAG